jgi:hypothetical protein
VLGTHCLDETSAYPANDSVLSRCTAVPVMKLKAEHSCWRNKFLKSKCVHIKKEIIKILKIITENVPFHIGKFCHLFLGYTGRTSTHKQLFLPEDQILPTNIQLNVQISFSNFVLVIMILNIIWVWISFMIRFYVQI